MRTELVTLALRWATKSKQTYAQLKFELPTSNHIVAKTRVFVRISDIGSE